MASWFGWGQEEEKQDANEEVVVTQQDKELIASTRLRDKPHHVPHHHKDRYALEEEEDDSRKDRDEDGRADRYAFVEEHRSNTRSFDEYKDKALSTEDRPWQIDNENPGGVTAEKKKPAATTTIDAAEPYPIIAVQAHLEEEARLNKLEAEYYLHKKQEAAEKLMADAEAEAEYYLLKKQRAAEKQMAEAQQQVAGLVQEAGTRDDERLVQEMKREAAKLSGARGRPSLMDMEAEQLARKFAEEITMEEPSRRADESSRLAGVPESNEPAVEECKTTEEHGPPAAAAAAVDEDLQDIDLDFVLQYDNAFNEFISHNPRFLLVNPDLVHSLRVTKLQALLEGGQEMEDELTAQLQAIETSKAEMQMEYHMKLRDASRKKAARDIDLRNQLNELNKATRLMEGTLTWSLVKASETRAKRQHDLLQDKPEQASCSRSSPRELVALLPQDVSDFQAVRDAAVPPSRIVKPHKPLNDEQQNELRQCQIDHALMKTEITVLQKKLAFQKREAQKLSWVETVLVRADDQIMNKLKRKYQKKIGLTLP